MSGAYISTALRRLVYERWAEHFSLVDGVIAPKTAVGRVTARLLQLNRPEQVLERQSLLTAGVLKKS